MKNEKNKRQQDGKESFLSKYSVTENISPFNTDKFGGIFICSLSHCTAFCKQNTKNAGTP
jgi:hypothetical protein